MGERQHADWKVYRRGSGLLIRGRVTHPWPQRPEIVHNPCARPGTISFAVHLEPLGHQSDEITTEVEYFEPNVPASIRRVEIIFAGGKVIIESLAKE